VQAQDRFAAGVTNNLEVVQAQEAVAAATDSYLAALYAHNLAKLSLARAVGVPRNRPASTSEDPGDGSWLHSPTAPGEDGPVGGRDCRALAVAALWWHLEGREVTDNAQIDGHITPIAARCGRTVAAVHVTDNQEVRAGSVLVEIDPRDYEVACKRAEADLADAEAALEAARRRVPIATNLDLRSAEVGRRERRTGAGGCGRRRGATSTPPAPV